MKDGLLDPEHRDFEEGLRRAGRDVRMSPAARARTLAAMGVSVGGAMSTSTAHAATASFWTSKGGLVAAVGTVVGGSAIAIATAFSPVDGGTDATSAPAIAPPPASTHSGPSTTTGVDDEVAPVRLGDLPEEATGSEAAPSLAPKLAKPRATPPTGEGASSSVAPSLGDEVTHLGRVETALRAGDPAAALSILAEYRARFAERRLGLEAEVLTIQALSESGAREAASARAQRFLERHPSSPLGAKAKQYLR